MKTVALSISALLAVSAVSLQAKPPLSVPQRGPLPAFFFKPVSLVSSQYPEEGKNYAKELDVQIRVKAEHAQEAWKKLESLLGRVIGPLGFQVLSDDQTRQFNLWKYQRPSAPGEALTRMFANKVVFVAKDRASLQKWLDSVNLLSSRSEGPAKGQIRQCFLRATVAGGGYNEGWVSYRLRFMPVLIGSLSYENPKVQESEISNLFAVVLFFNPEPLLSDLEIALGKLGSESDIKDLKLNLKL